MWSVKQNDLQFDLIAEKLLIENPSLQLEAIDMKVWYLSRGGDYAEDQVKGL